MQIVMGNPYFSLCKSKIKPYKYLDKNISCDILIVGGGIDGAIANYYLSQKYDTALVDKSLFGKNCTSCATALLEYQLDDFASELNGELNEQEICKIYSFGLDALKKLDSLVSKLGNSCLYSKRPSLLYSTRLIDTAKIKKEYDFRISNGFSAEYIDKASNTFPFKLTSGLYCSDGGAELNPYLFTKLMLDNSHNQNKIFQNTEIVCVEHKDTLVAHTSYGQKITCKNIIYATGFNWQSFTKKDLCKRYISYTITTQKISNLAWRDSALVQDCLDPYHYLRILPDNKLIFGGEDTLYYDKFDVKKAEQKYQKLENTLRKMLPDYDKQIKVDCKFCGLFGSTKNNLGLIGKAQENEYYLLSSGANGIVNAIGGIEIIEDDLLGKAHSLASVFSPKRLD
ncbi:MAG: FAD-dependent oxidoreductase [Clostridia bacterium]